MTAGLLWVLAGDLALVLAGAGPIWPLGRRVGLPLPPRLALSLLTGVGMLAVVTTVAGVLGGPTGLWPVVGPVLLAAAGAGTAVIVRGRLRPELAPGRHRSEHDGRRPAQQPTLDQPPGQPVAGQPIAGQPIAGQAVAGQPVAGPPVAGQPTGSRRGRGPAGPERRRAATVRRHAVGWLNPLWAGYAIVLAVAAPYAWTGWRLPVNSNDEYMMWALRGRMLAAGTLDPAVFGGAANPITFQSRDYPLGLPALFSWMFGWTGADRAEYAAHVQVPLLGAAALVVAVWGVGTLFGPAAGVLVAPGFFTATQVGRYTGALYFADLPVAAAGLAVAVLLLRWLAERRPEWLLLAAGPAVAAVYLKAEGTLFVVSGCVAAAAVARARRRTGRPRRWWAPLSLAGGAVVALLPWQAWLSVQHVPSRFFGGQKWGALGFGQLLDRNRLILANMAGYWPVPFSTYYAIAAVISGLLLALLVPAVRPAVAFLAVSITLIVAGLWLQYLLWDLRGPAPAAQLTSYMKFNAGRVELLPAVLGWVLAAVAVGGALTARRPRAAPAVTAAHSADRADRASDSDARGPAGPRSASAGGRSAPGSPRSAGPGPPAPARSPAHAGRR